MYLEPNFLMHLRGVALLALFLPGTGGRITRTSDSHDDQQTNVLTNGLEVSADAREAFLPSAVRSGTEGIPLIVGARKVGVGPSRATVDLLAATGPEGDQAIPGLVVPLPKTIGEAKAAFQKKYGRPVNKFVQGFVNEMLASVTLAVMKPRFQRSKVFSLGFEALCETFLESVNQEEKKELHDALCMAVGFDPKMVRKEAENLEAFANGKTEDELLAAEELKAIAAAGNFKYSYPLGAGLLTLMPMVGVEPSDEAIERWCTQLNLPASRLQKDWTLYVDAQRRMAEGRLMLKEWGDKSQGRPRMVEVSLRRPA